MHDLISKAATLLEALLYIQKFSGEIFVVKYGPLRTLDSHWRWIEISSV